jgi:thiol-disulfide isomerase/thioredoxin
MHKRTKKNNHGSRKKNIKGPVIIGLVYANWCGHCQSLKPEWETMKQNMMSSPSYRNGSYKFIEIEDSDNAKDAKISNINSSLRGGSKLMANGYPTIFKVHGGKLDYFQGGRTSSELEKWFSSKSIFGGRRRPGYRRRRSFKLNDLKSAPVWRNVSN